MAGIAQAFVLVEGFLKGSGVEVNLGHHDCRILKENDLSALQGNQVHMVKCLNHKFPNVCLKTNLGCIQKSLDRLNITPL
jgi:hypothetical protein